jgi:alpha-N-arabinofuranosidase
MSCGMKTLISLLTLVLVPLAPAAPLPALVNAGFEDADPMRSWKPYIYGAQPVIAADPETKREGRQSLRIESREPSDTAIAQDLVLPAGRLFRLTGWLRTRGLTQATEQGIGATFQIQCEGGRTFSSRSLLGTNDWTEEQVLFRVPPDGRVHIALFYFGFGKGTGTVWLDGMRLEEAQGLESDRLRVTDEQLGALPVSPFQVGQFVEILCDLIRSIHSEMLDHGSFEEFPPFRFVFRSEVDRRDHPWYPSGAVYRGEYTNDTENPFNGTRSLRIGVTDGEPCTLGISQGGLHVEPGKRYHLRLHLRANGEGITPQARLHGGGRELARGTLGPARAAWTKHEVELVARDGCDQATLTIEFRGPGAVWLDRVSLRPADAAPGGWRPDVVEALRALRPGMIRFGGSVMLHYEWEQGIGDPDRRVPFTTCWGGLEPNYVGLEEFIILCRLVEAEPLICVRWHGKKPEDAAAQVEYINGPADSPQGRVRAGNGHAEPYGVKYWQIGNEVGGPEYEASVRAFALAMKRADPSIKLLSSYPSEGVLREAADLIDYLCPHHYGCANLAYTEQDLVHVRDMIARLGRSRPIRVAVTEWNTTAGDWGLGRGMLLTLGNALACSRYHNQIQRQADLVEIAIRSNLADSFGSGIIQTDEGRLYRTPTYHAQQLYARGSGLFPVKIEGVLPAHLEDLDASALLAPDGKKLILYVVNDTRSAMKRNIDLSAFASIGRNARVTVLADGERAGERDVTNEFDAADRIAPQTGVLDISNRVFAHTFPALSLTVLEIETGP